MISEALAGQGDLFCSKPSFIHVTGILKAQDDSDGALNAFPGIKTHYRFSANSVAIMDFIQTSPIYRCL